MKATPRRNLAALPGAPLMVSSAENLEGGAVVTLHIGPRAWHELRREGFRAEAPTPASRSMSKVVLDTLAECARWLDRDCIVIAGEVKDLRPRRRA